MRLNMIRSQSCTMQVHPNLLQILVFLLLNLSEFKYIDMSNDVTIDSLTSYKLAYIQREGQQSGSEEKSQNSTQKLLNTIQKHTNNIMEGQIKKKKPTSSNKCKSTLKSKNKSLSKLREKQENKKEMSLKSLSKEKIKAITNKVKKLSNVNLRCIQMMDHLDKESSFALHQIKEEVSDQKLKAHNKRIKFAANLSQKKAQTREKMRKRRNHQQPHACTDQRKLQTKKQEMIEWLSGQDSEISKNKYVRRKSKFQQVRQKPSNDQSQKIEKSKDYDSKIFENKQVRRKPKFQQVMKKPSKDQEKKSSPTGLQKLLSKFDEIFANVDKINRQHEKKL